MVLPTSQFAALLLLLACLCSWALWLSLSAVTVSRWRYELYYLDVCAGLLLTSLLIVFTFGSLGSDMTFGDRLLVAGLTAKAWTALGGVALAFGNFLLLAGLSFKDRLSPFLAVVGAVLLSASWVRFAKGGAILLPITVGCVLFFGAVVYGAISLKTRKGPAKSAAKARTLSLVGGLFLGAFYPLVRSALFSDIGVGPYGSLLILSISIVVATLVLGIYFLNLPVNGPAVGFAAYRLSSFRNHLLGWLGGVLYGVGLISLLLGLSAGNVGS